MHHEVLRHTINQLFTSAQHLLLLILGLHVSTDHSVIFRSLICCKFQGVVHTFKIPIVFTLKLNPFISVGSNPIAGLDGPRVFQEVKDPRFRDNGTGWW